jgi:hypothetical protein
MAPWQTPRHWQSHCTGGFSKLGGRQYETTFLVPSRTKIMRQGVPRASLDADQLRYTAEQKAIKECKCIFLYPECTVNPEESLYPERYRGYIQSSYSLPPH